MLVIIESVFERGHGMVCIGLRSLLASDFAARFWCLPRGEVEIKAENGWLSLCDFIYLRYPLFSV